MTPTIDCSPEAMRQAEVDAAAALESGDFGAPAQIDMSKLPLLTEMSAERYHADPLPRPSLSASIAHTLTSRSPLHAFLQHPKLGGTRKAATDDMDFGSLVHALVLNQQFDLQIVHADNWRKPADQDKRDRARAEGRMCVLAKAYEDAIVAAKEIHVELAKRDIVLDGVSEGVLIWEEQTANGPVLCRGRTDHVKQDGLIIDFKTIRSAHPEQCTRNVVEHGYHLQASAYRSAVRQLFPDAAGRERFRWIFCEILPAGCRQRVIVTVAKPSGAMRELGDTLWARACETWAQCLRTGVWPAYVVGEASLEPPPWMLKDEYEAAERG